MHRDKTQQIFNRFNECWPNPTTQLNYQTNFELLIAVMLSAQATDQSVNQATVVLFTRANTPEQMLDLGEAGIKPYIHKIGLANTKARNIMKTCEILLARHEGEVPRERLDLEALPGVGRKTANVVLNLAFGESTIAVDTHIFRVANRTRLAVGNTPIAVEKILLKQVPADFLKNAHYWLITHGRKICRARRPLCLECLIADLCEYPAKIKN